MEADGRPGNAAQLSGRCTGRETEARYVELRIYDVAPGKLDAVLARFGDSIVGLYAKHGLDALGYWTSRREDGHDKFIYLISAADKESFDRSFKAFLADPAFRAAYAASEKANGKTVEKIDTLPLTPATGFPVADKPGRPDRPK